jgi:hypothetical protein
VTDTRWDPPLDVVEAKMQVGLQRGVLAWALIARDAAKLKAPVDTTRLAREIKEGSPYLKGRLVAACQYGVSGLEYALAQEFGSGLYIEQGPDVPGGHAPAKYKIEAGFWTGKSPRKVLAFAWPNGPKPHPAFDEDSGMYFSAPSCTLGCIRIPTFGLPTSRPRRRALVWPCRRSWRS